MTGGKNRYPVPGTRYPRKASTKLAA